MRPLKSHFPDHALTTLETMLKQTKEARVFRGISKTNLPGYVSFCYSR